MAVGQRRKHDLNMRISCGCMQGGVPSTCTRGDELQGEAEGPWGARWRIRTRIERSPRLRPARDTNQHRRVGRLRGRQGYVADSMLHDQRREAGGERARERQNASMARRAAAHSNAQHISSIPAAAEFGCLQHERVIGRCRAPGLSVNKEG